MKLHSTIAIITSLIVIGQAQASSTAIPGPTPTLATSTEGDWEFTLGLYGWAAGLEGDLGFGGFTTSADVSFSDIVESLDMTAMGMIEARKGAWLFQLEGLYLRNSIKRNRVRPITGAPTQAKLTAETTRLQPMLGYRVMDSDQTKVDVMGGVVYYNISNELLFLGPAATRGVSSSEGWVDPMIGVRVSHKVDPCWSLQGRADIGGFGVNSDIAWQLAALVGYRVNDYCTILGGWRHAAVDYTDGGFTYDVANSGPILGVTVSW